MEDRNFIVTRGDSRIAMTIGRNEDTIKFSRDHRFLIDDPESFDMNAYILTKPLKTGHVYNGEGVYSFVLQEVVSTDNDNFDLGIADYYSHFPDEGNKDVSVESIKPPSIQEDGGKKVWI